MKISFRQGIIRTPIIGQGPAWLQKSNLSGTTIDLNVVPNQPVTFTVAHYGANYVIDEVVSVPGAWGGASINSTNGPLPAGVTVYLYWDINLATGALTRGWTAVAPVVSATPPPNPLQNTCWFDTTLTRMRVWLISPAGVGQWQDCIRLFAAQYNSNANLILNSPGSQVGLTGYFDGGHLVLGQNNAPLKQQDGTFVSTASSLIVQQTTGQNVNFDAVLAYGQALEDIPAFYLVQFAPNKGLRLASSNSFTSYVAGIVTEPLFTNDVGRVISNGIVRWDQWQWDPSLVNMPVFCGPTGQVTVTAPPIGISQQVGLIYDVDAILLNIFPPVRIRT